MRCLDFLSHGFQSHPRNDWCQTMWMCQRFHLRRNARLFSIDFRIHFREQTLDGPIEHCDHCYHHHCRCHPRRTSTCCHYFPQFCKRENEKDEQFSKKACFSRNNGRSHSHLFRQDRNFDIEQNDNNVMLHSSESPLNARINCIKLTCYSSLGSYIRNHE
jgi:hypothetical protein